MLEGWRLRLTGDSSRMRGVGVWGPALIYEGLSSVRNHQKQSRELWLPCRAAARPMLHREPIVWRHQHCSRAANPGPRPWKVGQHPAAHWQFTPSASPDRGLRGGGAASGWGCGRLHPGPAPPLERVFAHGGPYSTPWLAGSAERSGTRGYGRGPERAAAGLVDGPGAAILLPCCWS